MVDTDVFIGAAEVPLDALRGGSMAQQSSPATPLYRDNVLVGTLSVTYQGVKYVPKPGAAASKPRKAKPAGETHTFADELEQSRTILEETKFPDEASAVAFACGGFGDGVL